MTRLPGIVRAASGLTTQAVQLRASRDALSSDAKATQSA